MNSIITASAMALMLISSECTATGTPQTNRITIKYSYGDNFASKTLLPLGEIMETWSKFVECEKNSRPSWAPNWDPEYYYGGRKLKPSPLTSQNVYTDGTVQVVWNKENPSSSSSPVSSIRSSSSSRYSSSSSANTPPLANSLPLVRPVFVDNGLGPVPLDQALLMDLRHTYPATTAQRCTDVSTSSVFDMVCTHVRAVAPDVLAKTLYSVICGYFLDRNFVDVLIAEIVAHLHLASDPSVKDKVATVIDVLCDLRSNSHSNSNN